MLTDPLFYKLLLVIVVWLCLMLHVAWPSERAAAHRCGPQKLDLPAAKGFPRLRLHDCMAYAALDIRPRSRNNMTEKA